MAPIRSGANLLEEEDGGGTVGAADDTYRTGLRCGEAQSERQHVGTEDAELGCRPINISLGLDMRAEKSVMAPMPKNMREGRPFQHTEVEVVEHGTVFVHTYLQAGIERDVTHDHTEAYRQQQHGFRTS